MSNRYTWDGEHYHSLAELLRGPIRRAHPTAERCFIEGGLLWISKSGATIARYYVTFEDRRISIGPLIG